MYNFTTRKATSIDIVDLSKLFNEYRIFYRKKSDIEKAIQFITERLSNKDSEIFVVESDAQTIVGFVQLYPLFSSTRMKRLWLLNDLFVAEMYRGLGLSKLLIEKAKNHCIATQACALILETEKENTIGNQLYLETGFTKDTQHNFYEWETD
jgi:GNAT superfamily N-acetyltransferase